MVTSFTALGHAQAASDDSAMTDTARELYVKGMSASNAQNWESCRAALLGAWALKPHWQIAGSLGYCEIKARKYRDAAEHLQYFITHAPASAADRVAESAAGLAEAKKHVGSLRLKVEPASASVDLDGVPLKDHSIVFVEPGSHSFRVVDGNSSKTTSVDVVAGEDRELVLVAIKTAGVAAPSESPIAPEPHKASRSVVPIVVGSAVAAIGIGVGVGMFAAAGGKYSDAEELGSKIKAMGGSCGPGSSSASADLCAQTADLLSSNASLRTWGTVSVGVGAAAAVFAVTYALWPKSTSTSKTTASAPRPVPWIGPDAGGMSFIGKF